MTPLLLGGLALVLSGPAPSVLGRITTLRRTPRASMLLWQATALAAVLAALGAGLALATQATLSGAPTTTELIVATVALALTTVVGARLLWKAHEVGSDLRSLRRRHRDLVDLLTSREAGVNVVDDPALMAYCLPGLDSRVVLSRGTRSCLSAVELDAVLAHERAHLHARHDLVLEAFTVLHEAFPRFVSSAAALVEVEFLVEVLADRAAVRTAGAAPLARALVALADSSRPAAAMGAGGPGLVDRVRLLADTGHHRMLAGSAALGAVLVLALPTVFVALPWLQQVAETV